MKKIALISIMFLSLFFMVSCGGDDETCEQNEDCATGFICDQAIGECIPDNEGKTDENNESGTSEGENNTPDEGAADGTNVPDDDAEIHEGGIYVTCTPGERMECYEGPSGTAGVGLCKTGYKECVEDGTDWSECRDQVLPVAEICSDGIDQDCDGSDLTPETAVDIDGDGYTYCNGDCCETGWDCLGDPEKVNPSSFEVPSNAVDDNCNGEVDEVVSACDANIMQDTTNPMDMAQSIDLCPAANEKRFGVLTAKLLFPDGTEGEIPAQQHAVLTGYGNVLKPKAGNSFLAFSTGKVLAGQSEFEIDNGTSSGAPADWLQANGGESFPDSPACNGLLNQSDPGKPPLNDPVMFELTIRAPKNAAAFGVGVYYISSEFPTYVCQYNDFFVMLLDSTFTSTDPTLQNPADKNIAMDSLGNPLGINLAKSGLFNVCCPRNAYPSCQGDEELKGTPFTPNQCPSGVIGAVNMENAHGATGWLEVRGNIVPGEEFKLRMAIWDTNDHVLDSMVLIDNFQWYEVAGKPGIAPK
ncbi:choice-of-anchor L domain-containing protein [bacterium]|nr:choice-of-anchor L domain-containing protein [bacterium]